jgi:ribonuclease Z
MNSWLLGRKETLHVHGLSHTLDRVEKLMDFYEWKHWPHFFPVDFRRVPEQELCPVLETSDLRILASPVHHLIPTIGLRIECLSTGHTIAYSCDTSPCNEVVRLAAGADVLIHESTGQFPGHSSAEQAGEIARRAGVNRLYLIHYPTGDDDHMDLLRRARETFGGAVVMAEDFMELGL